MDLAHLVAAALAAAHRDPGTDGDPELNSLHDTVAGLLDAAPGTVGYRRIGSGTAEPDELRSRLDGLPAADRRQLADAAHAVLARTDPAGTAAGHYDLTAALPVTAGPADPIDDPVRHLTTATATAPPGDPAGPPSPTGPSASVPVRPPADGPVGDSGAAASSPGTPAERARLALSAGSPGHSAGTVDVLRRMAADAELRLGPQHPQSLRTRSDLAYGYRAAGRTAEAIAEMRTVAATCQHLLGTNHPDTRAAHQALRDWTGRADNSAP
ncbi:tetratricopeptide repeat protein [Solwaraspora sp. WMMD1047]|uniref:tetratricopeptide repeat protein n=1 Tax=Solwaraspora sp. WMMD1047 TaxID=3016102 RepID=UPI0024163F73|nr:tetratricopeptide repeat protein [Solwaraspora sp. WMMD1047]MDG4828964.1 tetratricopeptide repeat protein [Solwaraspora sp. WMMD1047]